MPGPFDSMNWTDPSVVAATGGMSPFMPGYNRWQGLADSLGGMGQALVAASAPSPYPRDFGTVFGALGAGASAGLQNSEDKQLKRALTGSQVAMAQQKIKQLQDWQKLFSGAASPPAAGPAAVTPDPTNPSGTGANGAAIAGIESKGQADPYTAVGPVSMIDGKESKPYGKYQVMDFNIGPWTQEILGKPMTPQEFVANPQAQDAVFNGKFGQYLKQYGNPQDAASAWFSGKPLAAAVAGGNKPDVLGTTPTAYVQKFNSGLGGPVIPVSGGAAPPIANGQGDSAAPQVAQAPQAVAAAGKTLSQVVQGIPPGVRQMIGVMGPEQGLPLLMKYADPEKVPAFNTQTKEFLFVDKTDLGKHPSIVPVDAAQFGIALQREAREAANAKVIPGPGGAMVPNGPLLDFDKGVSAAQGTDPAGHILKAQADDVIKRNSDWQKQGVMAQSTVHNLNVFDKLADQVKTGRFQGSVTDMKAALKGAGIDIGAWGIPDNVAPAQAMQMISQRFALEMRQEMPGPMSDGDRKFMVAGALSIERDPNANKIMAEWLRGNAQRNIDRAKFAREYMNSPEFSKKPGAVDDYVEQKLAGKDYFNHSVLPTQKPGSLPMPPANGVRRWNPEKGALE